VADSLTITVTEVNDAPTRTSAAATALSVAEDSANTTAASLGLSSLTYGKGGGSDESSQTLTVTINTIPSFVTLYKADGSTPVSANATLTVAELQGLKYKTVADANGTGTITWTVAILVGVAQVVAGVFPGTSRSAATIFAALLLGVTNRAAATEFAFLVGIPTMFAATGYELFDLYRAGGTAGEDWGMLAVAFTASAITAFAAVKWLLHYIQSHRFTVFALYRFALGAALLAFVPS